MHLQGVFPYIDGFQVKKESGEKIDTTDMPDLDTEESAAERRKQQG